MMNNPDLSGAGSVATITAAVGIGIATGIAISWITLGRRPIRSAFGSVKQVYNQQASNAATYSSSSDTVSANEISTFSEYNTSEFKLVILLRTDLEMGKGKIAAQCCHAAVGAYAKLTKTNEGQQILKRWRQHGEPKVVLKVANEAELTELSARARNAGLPVSVIADAGRTQIASGTLTVSGIGPAPKVLIDKITGHLKLY